MRKWIDIKEKFPTENNKKIIIFLNMYTLYEGFVCEAKIHVLSKDGFSYRLLKSKESVTHWIELPKLPKLPNI